jgi:hypothetical protein
VCTDGKGVSRCAIGSRCTIGDVLGRRCTREQMYCSMEQMYYRERSLS